MLQNIHEVKLKDKRKYIACIHKKRKYNCKHRKFSNIRRTQSKTLNVPRLVLHLFWLNPLKPDVKSRMNV